MIRGLAVTHGNLGAELIHNVGLIIGPVESVNSLTNQGRSARELVGEYYVAVRAVLRVHPHLVRCLTHCRHCGLFLFTAPCNAGRKDLLCSFGCREAHRKRSSTSRSVAYYRTKSGRFKKRIQNSKRVSGHKGKGPAAPGEAKGDECPWTTRMVEHVRMVTSLIERRRVSLREIREMLRRALRQQSLGKRKRIDYIMGYLNRASP